MRGYLHLSEDEREQIGLLRGRWAIRSAPSLGRSAVRSRRSRANYRATGCPAGATRRFTLPELINCAGGVKR